MIGEKSRAFSDLITWVEDIKRKNKSSASALYIVKDGEVLLEHYSGNHSHDPHARPVTASSQFNIASARKSYLGLAIAFALYDRHIHHLDEPILKFLPELDRDVMRDTTIRHLATHSHGLDRDESGTIYRQFKAGTGWAYHNIGVELLTILIQRLYGIDFPSLLEERVFSQMEFKETGWRTEKTDHLVDIIDEWDQPSLSGLGSTADGSDRNLFVSARELALWGELHLNEGRMHGRQIVPVEVIKLATSIQNVRCNDPALPDNGLFWYVQDLPRERSEIGERVPKGSYQILGVTGPTILVIPSMGVVVAKMYNKRYNYGGEGYLHYLREFSNKVADLFSAPGIS
ncbi:serine hydrolase domain-containing protein [Bacillus sp. KH172YL63]|uniref:serine hydrolase domain-containing protein n=1 Tax=Bacillus sp. KH172YL63 TaxID=2709784 RepID=UPI0013E41FA0|nr:serine hydrolase domain-containing protein [Bacillus sp. KH172YL63]BCB03745.1 penicillin-binding protein [Bacillus sp. KH172YL63]